MMLRMAKCCLVAAVFLAAGFLLFVVKDGLAGQPLCGDSRVEGWEECDNGQFNSDSTPNACRSNCTLPKCGDYAVDNGEECDDDIRNSNEIPNACRRDCRRAHCGDGVLDNGEECDDKNTEDYDGCSKCRLCYPPKDDLVVSDNIGPVVRLCPGTYELQDKGQEGIVIVAGQDVRVDATDVWLVGAPHTIATAAQTQVQANKQLATAAKGAIASVGSKIAGMRSKRSTASPDSNSSTPADQSQGTTPSGTPPATPPGSTTTLRQGTGIVVTGNNTILHNVSVRNFKTGIKIKGSGNVLLKNVACDNNIDISAETSDNFGVKDTCSATKDWTENNQAASCMQRCQ